MDVGAIENFDVSMWTKLANFLTAYDEPLMALEILNKLPAYYRDNVPAEIIELKTKIRKNLATPTFYANNIEHAIATPEESVSFIQGTLRGKLVFEEVKGLNDKGFYPHIFELAPGPYCLPIGLKRLGLSFSYNAKSLNPETMGLARAELGSMWSDRPPSTSQKNIFIAFEIIEHLHYPEDIAAEYYRYGMKADFIHLSTPLYTFDGRASSINWEDKDLGHLRTYTPDEFVKSVLPMFPNDFSWQLHKAPVMHLRGERNGNKFL